MASVTNGTSASAQVPPASDASPPLLVEREGSRLTIRVLQVKADPDSTDFDGPAHLLVERKDSRLTIRVLRGESPSNANDLTYELTVDRTGTSTSRTRQTGTLAPTGALSDTLSKTRINVQPGDQLSLCLVLRRGSRVVDTVCRDEVASPSR